MNITWRESNGRENTLTVCVQIDSGASVVCQRTESEGWFQVSGEMDSTNSTVPWRRFALANPAPTSASFGAELDRHTQLEQRELGWIRYAEDQRWKFGWIR